MRIILGVLILLSFLSPKAQTHLPVSGMNFTPWLPFPGYHPFTDNGHSDQKWYIYTCAGISSGAGFYSGGSTIFMSAPIGIQLNRPLTNNLTAFAGISASPAFFSTNPLYSDPFSTKSYPGNGMSNTYGFGMNSRVEMGLMYINDAKTFSLSGSIGIDRSTYPVYPADKTNTKK